VRKRRKLRPCEFMFQGVLHDFAVVVGTPVDDSEDCDLGVSYTAFVYLNNRETNETELVCSYGGNDHNELHRLTFKRAARKCYEHLASKSLARGAPAPVAEAGGVPTKAEPVSQPSGQKPGRKANRPFIKSLQWNRAHDSGWPVWTFNQDVLDEIVAGLTEFRWAKLRLRDHRGRCVGQVRFDHRIVLPAGNDGRDYYKIDVKDVQRRFPELVLWYTGYTEDGKRSGVSVES